MSATKKIAFSSFLLLLSFLGFCIVALVKGPTKEKKPQTYTTLWKRVDSCERKGLTETALKTVLDIYGKAKNENNAAQVVKAVLYKLKFAQYKEEFSSEKNIADLHKEIESSKFPVKAILHSILADAYWQYYQNNRWKFYNRSNTASFLKNDVATYSLKDIVNAAVYQFNQSLKETSLLQQTSLDVYDEIILRGSASTRAWRPTLYDFLAHRALDFYKNSEADVSKAANQFSFNEETFLKPYPDFLSVKLLPAADSLDFRYHTMLLFQELTAFHQKNNTSESLLDLEMERLEFIYQNSRHPKKDAIYLQSIAWLSGQFKEGKRVAELEFLRAEWEMSQASLYRPLEDTAHKWHKKNALQVCNRILKLYPKSRAALMASNLADEIKTQHVNIETEKVNDPQRLNRILVNYGNVPKLYFKLVQSNFIEHQQLSRKYYGRDLYSKLVNLPLVQSFEQNLPDDGDYNSHSCELKVDPLAPGFYVLLASTSKDFTVKDQVVTYQTYIVSDIAYLSNRTKNGENNFYVLSREHGQPKKGVAAQVWYYDYDYQAKNYTYTKGNTYTSDELGHFKIEAQDRQYRNYQVEFTDGKDQLFSSDNFYSHRNNTEETGKINSFIFTDRAMYRPGQTVYFKSLLLNGLRNKHNVMANHPVTITFYDVNNQKIASQDLVTNEYGTIAGSFTAPQGVLNGQMMLGDGISTKYIQVEEYKRPKFETKFDTLKGEYTVNDTVLVKGFATAYAGNAIDGADVKYRVVRTVNYPYWWYWYRPWFQQGGSLEITNGLTKTNEKGEYQISFVALPDATSDKKDNPSYTYEILADVTDINGETHSTSTFFTAGYKSLSLSFDCPETINVLQIPRISFTAQNMNGVEEKVNGSFSLYQLETPKKVFRKRLWAQPDKQIYTQEEYYKLFPNDQYADETNKYTWKRSKKVLSKNFNSAQDKNTFWNEFKSLTPGMYLAESICKDKNGEELKAINYITVYNPNGNDLPYSMAQWNYPLKTTAEPGEKASFILASSYPSVFCLYEHSDFQGSITSTINPSIKAIEIPVAEKQRGGVSINTRFVKHGRVYSHTQYIQVPFTNKELDITYSSFRNKLMPGQAEEWTLKIRNKKGENVVAEMLAGMYDASLDAFVSNNWSFNIYESFYAHSSWIHSLEDVSHSSVLHSVYRNYTYPETYTYDQLNYFGLNFYGNYTRYGYTGSGGVKNKRGSRKHELAGEPAMLEESAAPMAAEAGLSDASAKLGTVELREQKNQVAPKNEAALTTVSPRKNFNETAFFFPNLHTNENGDVLIKFTVPESLTRWKLMGLAHTKDLSYGLTQHECVTQKDVMVVPNAPRFLREGDEMTFIAKVSNLSNKEITGLAQILFYDAFTEKDVSAELLGMASASKTFTLTKGLSTTVDWKLTIPAAYSALKYKVVATAGNYSDGEETVLPVLPNRMLVTESMPLPIRGKQSKEFSFSKFINQNNRSTTLRNHAYTLEFTANPAWYAVQCLPYLMEYPYECAEQTFARFYANALATHIANSKPKIKQIFEAWKTSSPETFLSNLEKNQELKALLLQETPWLLQAKNESENKKRVALLFDLTKMSQELTAALTKLEKMQTPNGAWPWFNGCPEDWYITQHILTGLGHLQKLGVTNPEKKDQIEAMIEQGLRYCDNQLYEAFEKTKRYSKKYKTENHLSYMAIQYLYMRSYFIQYNIPSRSKEAIEYYKKQAQTYWLQNGRSLQGMLALSLNRFGNKQTATSIVRSLKENSLNNDEMGMYWKENYGFYWHQAPIEMQALMIEAFDEVAGDLKSVDDLKTWLIKSKQTQHWGTTRATTEAVYALLLKGTDWLAAEPNVELYLGDLKIDPKNDPSLKAEAGTGYFKKTFFGNDIQPAMGKVNVIKKDDGVSWGAVYWQYFEQLDKISPHETPLKLTKKLFVQRNTSSGPVIEPVTGNSQIKVGDKLKIRVELRVDRDMEYVHLKDMRAAGLEPVNVISTYKYQDGLEYYESTADAATNFFIPYLPKGTYVFEYPVLVSHAGNFSNGISSIQCMYAPEFTSHSEGMRITVTR